MGGAADPRAIGGRAVDIPPYRSAMKRKHGSAFEGLEPCRTAVLAQAGQNAATICPYVRTRLDKNRLHA